MGIGRGFVFICAVSFVAVSVSAASGKNLSMLKIEEPVSETNTSRTSTTSSTSTTTEIVTTPTTPPVDPPVTPPAPPAPTPLPPAQTGTWTYADNNLTCIVLQTALHWNVSYIDKDNNKKATLFNLPVSATTVAGGSCGNDTQSIVLQWPVDNSTVLFNNVTLEFKKNVTSSKYAISKIECHFPLNSSYFPNGSDDGISKTADLVYTDAIFSVPLTKSYRCAHEQSFNLTIKDSVKSEDKLNKICFSNLQEEAFLAQKGHSFSSALDCDNSDVPDAVPIAVGIALAVAVLLVLVGYLIGRRRSQARGYLSM